LKLLRKLQPNCRSLLEYGAGAAPITHAILEHNSCKSDCEFVIADLPTLVFHYAKHKFRQCSNVEAVVLDAEHSFRFETDRKFDAVFCCQVFEHLTEPLETAKRFAEMLTDDGVLYFDFAMSDARGLDSRQGMEERNQVLDFIASEFSIEHGCIDPARDVGFTAARRKR
jgi:SAM-dependent methyltransferase